MLSGCKLNHISSANSVNTNNKVFLIITLLYKLFNIPDLFVYYKLYLQFKYFHRDSEKMKDLRLERWRRHVCVLMLCKYVWTGEWSCIWDWNIWAIISYKVTSAGNKSVNIWLSIIFLSENEQSVSRREKISSKLLDLSVSSGEEFESGFIESRISSGRSIKIVFVAGV